MVTLVQNTNTNSVKKSCKEIKDPDPSAVSGVYEMEVQGEIIELFCEMQIWGGGWAVSF